MLVSLTPRGRAALDQMRDEYRSLLREHVRALSDADVAALLDAAEALGRVIEAAQSDAR